MSIPPAALPSRLGRNRTWRPWALALLALALGVTMAWPLDTWREEHLSLQQRAAVQRRLNVIGSALTSAISQREGLVAALAAFAELHDSDEGLRRDFPVFAAGLHANDEAIRVVQIFPHRGPVLAYPSGTNEVILNRSLTDLRTDSRPHVRDDVQRAIATSRITLSQPYELRQGGQGVVARKAIRRDGNLWGIATVIVSIDSLLERTGMPQSGSELRIAVRDSSGRVFFGDADTFAAEPVVYDAALPEGTWLLAATPLTGWPMAVRSQLLPFRVGAGLLILLLAGTVFTFARHQRNIEHTVELRTRELAERERDLRRLFEEAEAARTLADNARAQIAEMVERISDGFATLDSDGRFTFANPKLEQMLGRRTEEIAGRKIDAVFPEAAGPQVPQACQEALRDQRAIELEYSLVPVGRWFQLRLYPSPTGLSMFCRDITVRKAGEESLRASEEQSRELTSRLPVPVAFVDANRQVQFVNDRFAAVFGYTLADVPTLEHWWLHAYPDPDYRAEVSAAWAEQIAEAMHLGTEVSPREYRVTCKSGEVRLMEIVGIPIRGGFLAMFNDVTERRRAEEQAAIAQAETRRLLAEAEQSRQVLLSLIEDQKEAENRLRLHGAALEAAANAVMITNRAGLIEWTNPAFTALSGWTLAEVAGKNPRDLLKSGEHDAAFYRQMWETLRSGKVWRGEVINRRKDGKLRTEDMTVTPLRDAAGEITHFIAIKQDITERKVMELQFLQSQRMEAIGTLAGGIAHDLNNILAPILMVSSVLKHRLPDEADRELLAMTQTSAKRGADSVKQLLAFSRGHMGERSAVQPRHLLKEMIQIMRETFPREIDLRQHTAENLWTVVADPTQLHQVLLNLCVNARDAMPTGGCLTVGARNATLSAGDSELPPQARPGPYVVLQVCDTGTGIAPEIRHRIFDPFFTTKEIGKGTGLGLSTVLAIVQNHGGFITVDSAATRGTTFDVYLPAQHEPAELPSETAAPQPPASQPIAQGQTILVVDDEREVRDTIRMVLEHEGHRVFTAAQGEEALAQYLQHRVEVQLVITDVMMPVMNGVALARALRAIDSRLRIVAMSGLTELAQRRDLESIGVTDMLMKPFSAPSLIDAVGNRAASA